VMEIENKKVAKWLEEKKSFHLLDVRLKEEREFSNLGGFHIPLHELETRYQELPHDRLALIVYCHHGVRSLHATQFLKYHGYDVLSLRGGIEAWSLEIDPNVPRY
jgi:rhodanese-related sulfurtransferase